MSKGDKIVIKTLGGDESIEAVTNGATVRWETEKDSGIQWITASEISKVGKTVRMMKFKIDHVIGIVEVPAKPF